MRRGRIVDQLRVHGEYERDDDVGDAFELN
jgi:hypothetical protein